MKPLSIEELKALETGDWVWTEINSNGRYIQILGHNEKRMFVVSHEFEEFLNFKNYGKTWLAYKNKEFAESKGEWVELPCKVGDTIYYIEYFCDHKGCSVDEQQFCCGCKEMIERERKNEKYVIAEKKFKLTDLSRIGKKYFTDKSEAEHRLSELKGEDKK